MGQRFRVRDEEGPLVTHNAADYALRYTRKLTQNVNDWRLEINSDSLLAPRARFQDVKKDGMSTKMVKIEPRTTREWVHH